MGGGEGWGALGGEEYGEAVKNFLRIPLKRYSIRGFLPSIEGVCGIRPQVTFHVVCNSPYVL